VEEEPVTGHHRIGKPMLQEGHTHRKGIYHEHPPEQGIERCRQRGWEHDQLPKPSMDTGLFLQRRESPRLSL
jgi:hypothetical protein